MKNITLLLTIYNPTKTEINYWIDFDKKYSNQLEIHWLIDNPDYSGIKYINEEIPNERIFNPNKNFGQFLTIINHLKTNSVKTSHFKVVDPDDYISFENLTRINLLDSNSIYFFNWTKIKEVPLSFDDKNITKIINDNNQAILGSDFANSCTILPTKFYTNLNREFKRINMSQDKVLGHIAYSLGAKIKYVDVPFYYYVVAKGVTGSADLKWLIEESIEAYQEILDFEKFCDFKSSISFEKTIIWFEKLIENKKLTKKLKRKYDELICIINSL